MRIIFCEDDPKHRTRYKKWIEKQWEQLRSDGIVEDALRLDVASDIVFEKPLSTEICLREIGNYDAVLLDIVWTDRAGNSTNYGVDVAKRVRNAFPEMPIVMFTEASDPTTFNELLGVGISGYVSKGDNDFTSIPLQIYDAIERARTSGRGLALYKLIRECTVNDGWQGNCVNEAASAAWRFERPHDRWEAFWSAFAQPLATEKLTSVFDSMRKFFAGNDLFMLGAMPGMRGHLEHVLSVYFTGYVISNKLPGFRENAIKAAKHVLRDEHEDVDEDRLWDFFQMAWLASATLHDTAYPLELLPAVVDRCSEISKLFKGVVEESPSTITDVEESPTTEAGKQYLREMGTLLVQLDTGIPESFLSDNLTFQDKHGKRRINHGVASALLFVSKATKSGASGHLKSYMKWAGAAMALHSLKKPGKEHGISLDVTKDPLSYLMMICDEIQVWERERPDATSKSPFKSVELRGFQINDTEIECELVYRLYDNTDTKSPHYVESRTQMDASFAEDQSVLSEYVEGHGTKVRLKRSVPEPHKFTFSEVCF